MKQKTINVTLTGYRPIMFDRFPGSLKTADALEPMEKLYTEGENLIFPAENILSFLSSQSTESAPKRIMGRGWQAIARAALSFVDINPGSIPIRRNGNNLTVDNAGVRIHHAVARVKKGQLSIPSPKARPVIDDPWELNFTLTLFENKELNVATLKKLFNEGGTAIGLGTYRGVYGKFLVSMWQEI